METVEYLNTLSRLGLPITFRGGVEAASTAGSRQARNPGSTGATTRSTSRPRTTPPLPRATAIRTWRVTDPAALKAALGAAVSTTAGRRWSDVVCQPLHEANAAGQASGSLDPANAANQGERRGEGGRACHAKLTDEQIRRYDEDGYLVLPRHPEPGRKSPSSRPMPRCCRRRSAGTRTPTSTMKDGTTLRAAWAVEIDSEACRRAMRLPRILGPVLQLTGRDSLPLPVAPELQDGAQRRRVPVAPGLRQLGPRTAVPDGGPSPDAQRADHARRHDGGKRGRCDSSRAPMSKDCLRSEYDTATTSYALQLHPRRRCRAASGRRRAVPVHRSGRHRRAVRRQFWSTAPSATAVTRDRGATLPFYFRLTTPATTCRTPGLIPRAQARERLQSLSRDTAPAGAGLRRRGLIDLGNARGSLTSAAARRRDGRKPPRADLPIHETAAPDPRKTWRRTTTSGRSSDETTCCSRRPASSRSPPGPGAGGHRPPGSRQ